MATTAPASAPLISHSSSANSSSSKPITIPLLERFSSQLSTGSADSGVVVGAVNSSSNNSVALTRKSLATNCSLDTRCNSLCLHGTNVKWQLQKLKQPTNKQLLSQDSGIDAVVDGGSGGTLAVDGDADSTAGSRQQLKSMQCSSSSSESLGGNSSGLSLSKYSEDGGESENSSGICMSVGSGRRIKYRNSASTCTQGLEDRIEEVDIPDDYDEEEDDDVDNDDVDVDEDDEVDVGVDEDLDVDEDEDEDVESDSDSGNNSGVVGETGSASMPTTIGTLNGSFGKIVPTKALGIKEPPPANQLHIKSSLHAPQCASAPVGSVTYSTSHHKANETNKPTNSSSNHNNLNNNRSSSTRDHSSSSSNPQAATKSKNPESQVLATDGNYYFPLLKISDDPYIDSKLINKKDGLQDTMYYLDEFGSPKLREKFARKQKEQEQKQQKAQKKQSKREEERKKRTTMAPNATAIFTTEKHAISGATMESKKPSNVLDNATNCDDSCKKHRQSSGKHKCGAAAGSEKKTTNDADTRITASNKSLSTASCVSWNKVFRKFKTVLGKWGGFCFSRLSDKFL